MSIIFLEKSWHLFCQIKSKSQFENNWIKKMCLAVPANVHDYVLVHVGFAISKVDEQEAKRVFENLEEIDELEELQSEKEAFQND